MIEVVACDDDCVYAGESCFSGTASYSSIVLALHSERKHIVYRLTWSFIFRRKLDPDDLTLCASKLGKVSVCSFEKIS